MIKKNSKKIQDSRVLNGYEVGKLSLIIQGVPDAESGIPIKGVFGNLKVKKPDEKKEESINFVFALDSEPKFRTYILSIINEAINQKVINEKEQTKNRNVPKANDRKKGN